MQSIRCRENRWTWGSRPRCSPVSRRTSLKIIDTRRAADWPRRLKTASDGSSEASLCANVRLCLFTCCTNLPHSPATHAAAGSADRSTSDGIKVAPAASFNLPQRHHAHLLRRQTKPQSKQATNTTSCAPAPQHSERCLSLKPVCKKSGNVSSPHHQPANHIPTPARSLPSNPTY